MKLVLRVCLASIDALHKVLAFPLSKDDKVERPKAAEVESIEPLAEEGIRKFSVLGIFVSILFIG